MDIKYRFLERLAAVQQLSWDEMSPEEQGMAASLKESGLVRCEMAYVSITPEGRAALAAEQERAQQAADLDTRQRRQQEADRAEMALAKKKDRRHDFFVSAFSVALTLLVEHFASVVHFICQLAEKILALFQG